MASYGGGQSACAAMRECGVIDSVGRAIDVLEYVGTCGEAKLSDIVAKVGCSRATVFRILSTLAERGYIEHDVAHRAYRLGSACFSLVDRVERSQLEIYAQQIIAELRRQTVETINFASVVNGQVRYVQVSEGSAALRMCVKVGDIPPVHATALGKAVLATMSPRERDKVLGAEPYERFTLATVTSRRKLEDHIALGRHRGYWVDEDETIDGASCVGAVVLGRNGEAIGALSISAPSIRMTASAQQRLGALVRSYVSRLSEQLRDGASGAAQVAG